MSSNQPLPRFFFKFSEISPLFQAPPSYGSGRYGFGVSGAQDSVLRDRCCSVGTRHVPFLDHFYKHLSSVLGWTELCHEVRNPGPQISQIINNQNNHLALFDYCLKNNVWLLSSFRLGTSNCFLSERLRVIRGRQASQRQGLTSVEVRLLLGRSGKISGEVWGPSGKPLGCYYNPQRSSGQVHQGASGDVRGNSGKSRELQKVWRSLVGDAQSRRK